jgi:uncharacterized membrane protein YjgN (DUF898 family)
VNQSSIAPGASPSLAEERHPVEFTATAGEYFRIWIVNLGLTLVTLGIYSAWAKVRKRRYLYSHTRIGGDGFEYRAKPWPILKGRLIALGILLVVVVALKLAPTPPAEALARLLRKLAENLAFLILFVFAGPWVIVKSFKFNAYNTAYRNIRFRFGAAYLDCLRITAVYGWMLILLILYPYVKRRLVQFVAENHFYGTTRFTVLDFKKPFIHAYAVGYGLGFLVAMLGGIVAAIATAKLGKSAQGPGTLFVLGVYASLLPIYAYIRARTINAVWNNIRIGAVRFESLLRARDLIWLYVSNLVAIVLTLGLATPWAVIRTHRYRASKTTVIASGPLDSFMQAEAQQVSAVGEQVGEMFEIDIGL